MTNIPANFGECFNNRIKAVFGTTANPYNAKQISKVSLEPEDVEAIVFLTKDARPFLKYLDSLDELGYRYYFQYTLNGYDKCIEPNVPDLNESIDTIKELSSRIGKKKVIWRYDPIILSNITPAEYHIEKFESLLQRLDGHIGRIVISIVDEYRAATNRMKRLEDKGIKILDYGSNMPAIEKICKEMVSLSKQSSLEIFSCAEILDLAQFGIYPGKCIDDKLIEELFGIRIDVGKDKSQRKECGCVASKDIGSYDTCGHGCEYCYATRSMKAALEKCKTHDPDSPSMIGWHEAQESLEESGQMKLKEEN
jgi:DNA repair photolyase